MDDDTLKVAFPVGGSEVIVSRPTEGQMMALVLSRNPTTHEENVRFVRRIARVLESLMGAEQWDNVFEDQMISGAISASALGDLASDVINFDWTAHEKSVTEPAAAPAAPQAEPDRPAPRVVSGG